MAFTTFKATDKAFSTTASSSWQLDSAASPSVAAGDLILCLFTAGTQVTFTDPTDPGGGTWTRLAAGNLPGTSIGAYWLGALKCGASTSLANLGSLGLSATSMGGYATIHYGNDWDGTLANLFVEPASGTSTTPDPPNATPPGGAKDYTWVAFAGTDANPTFSAFPTNYGHTDSGRANNTAGAAVAVCDRQLNAASENPGTFTISSSQEWFAFTIAIPPVGAGTTAVGRELATTWKVRAPIGRSLVTTWHTRAAVGRSRQTSWHVRTFVGLSRSTSWHVRTFVGLSRSTTWKVRAAVGPSLVTTWRVRSKAAKSLQTTWHTRALSGQKSLQTTWHVRAAVGKSLSTTWVIIGPVGRSLQTSWHVRSTVHQTRELRWGILTPVTRSLQTSWHVEVSGPGAVGRDLGTSWNVQAVVGASLATTWRDLVLITRLLETRFHVRAARGRSLQTSWDVLATAADIIYIGASSALALNSGVTATVDLPGSLALPLAVGDLLLCKVTGKRNATVFTMSGWTEVYPKVINSGLTEHTFAKWATAADVSAGSATVTADNATNGFSALAFAYRNVHHGATLAESFEDILHSATLTGLTAETPLATPNGPGRRMVAYLSHAALDLGGAGQTNPIGSAAAGDYGDLFSGTHSAATGTGHSFAHVNWSAEDEADSYGRSRAWTTNARWIGTIFALRPAEGGAGTTAVGRSLATTWKVRAAVGRSRSTLWHVRSAVGQSRVVRWHVLIAGTVGRNLTLRWNTQTADICRYDAPDAYDAPDPYDCAPEVGTFPVGRSLIARYHVRTRATRSLATTWRVFSAAAGRSLSTTWRVRNAAGRAILLSWRVQTNIVQVVPLTTLGYRILLYNMGANRGPGTLTAAIYDSYNMGASEYYNGPGTFFFTVPLLHRQASAILPWRTHYRVERITPTGWVHVFSGILTDYDATDHEVVAYGIDYLALLNRVIDTRFNAANPDLPHTSGGSKYVTQSARAIILDILGVANGQSNSPVAFISLADPESHIDPNHDYDETLTVFSTYTPVADFVIGLVNAHREGSQLLSRFWVEHSGNAWRYRVSHNSGTYRPRFRLEYGGLVQSFRLIPFGPEWSVGVAGVARSREGLKVHYTTQQGHQSLSTFGNILRPHLFDSVEDLADLQRRSKTMAQEASEPGQNFGLAVRVHSLQPFEGWQIGDSLPVDISRGFIDTQGSQYTGDWAILGVEWRWINNRDDLTLVLRPKRF